MWPYMVRLNPTGVTLVVVACFCLYILYSASTPSHLRQYRDDPIAARHKDEMQAMFAETINLRKLLMAGIKAAEMGGQAVVKVRETADLAEKSKGLTKEGAREMVTKGDLKSHFVMVEGLSATFTGLQIISEENHQTADAEQEAENLAIKPFHHKDFVPTSNDLKALPFDKDVPLKDVTVWIDPLDATQEYTERDPSLLKYVTTMMCVALSGKPLIGVIHSPFEKKTYWGWAGEGISLSLKEFERSKAVAEREGETTIIVSRSHSGTVEHFLKSALGEELKVVPAGGAGYKTIEVIKGHADAYVHKTLIKKWDICAPNAILDALGGKMTTLNGHSISYGYQESEKNEDGLLAAATYTDHEDFLARLKSRL